MKCGYMKNCKFDGDVDKDEAVVVGKRYWHKECLDERDKLRDIKNKPKCKFTQCKCDSDKVVEYDGKYYHEQCKLDVDNLNRIAELYLKYYNENESWAIMMRSLYNWYKKHSSEYMLFATSKAIRAKRKLNTFMSLYYVLNDNRIITQYNEYKNKSEIMVFDNVTMTEVEYNDLKYKMGDSLKKVEYYIKRLSDYMNKTNKNYDSHYSTILNWYNNDEEKKVVIRSNDII